MASQRDLDVALLKAAEEGTVDEVRSLLDRHANVNAVGFNNNTPLHHASMNGHHQCVELLLDRHADINARDYIKYTPLHLASSRGHRQCIEILLEYGADKSLISVRVSQHMQASLS